MILGKEKRKFGMRKGKFERRKLVDPPQNRLSLINDRDTGYSLTDQSPQTHLVTSANNKKYRNG